VPGRVEEGRAQFGGARPAAGVEPASDPRGETGGGQSDLFGAPAPPAGPASKARPPQPAAAPLVIPVVPAPQGSYPQRLSEVMALRKERTPQAIGALIAALADSEANIRWLASSTLAAIGGEAVIAALRVFLEQAPSEDTREEAVKLLAKLEQST
jgi:hypothetical protein